MPNSQPNVVLRYLRTVSAAECALELADQELLERFTSRRDEAAFAALVRRHGPMVFRLCRRILHNEHDAEDAFQATFLALSRKAGLLRPRASLGGWLHDVAYRIAQKARIASARRARHEGHAAARQVADPLAQISLAEAHELLDRELARLPDKFRIPLVLCYLEGLTRDEAAQQLGWSSSTLKSRLEQARERLRRRLGSRGLALSGALVASLFYEETASAAVPAALLDATVKAATLLAAGGTAAAVVPARVASLSEGGLNAMFRTKLRVIAAVVIAFGLVGVGAIVLTHRAAADKPAAAQPENSPQPDVKQAEAPGNETGDQRATRLGLRAHAQAAAFDRLPRFGYQVRYRHGIVDSMRAVDVSLERLTQALTDPVLDKDWVGGYESTFEWDEKRFVWEVRPGQTTLNYLSRSWTATEAWERHEATDRSSRDFVRMAGPAQLWKSVHLFDYSYLRLTPHRYWWGQTVHSDQTMSRVPPAKASWKELGAEKFGDEVCDVVESALRAERLWIGQESGRVRGVLSYYCTGFDGDEAFHKADTVQRIAGRAFATGREYGTWWQNEATEDQLRQLAVEWCQRCAAQFPANATPNELVRFDDYTEIAPGVWLPFREVRSVPYPSETAKDKHLLRRTELLVEQVRTDTDLSDRYARLLPKEGDRVQDQRFAAAVDYQYSARRTDEEIRKLADAEYQERLKGQEEVKRALQPLDALVGKQAPELPADGWVGGRRPELTGKPYLLHFWMTSCGPCKGDFPRLKALAENGVVIVGMHPAGTPVEDVERVIREANFGYPTFLDPARNPDAKNPTIGGYPAVVFPYYVLVDAQGRVAGHGFLSEILDKFGAEGLRAAPKETKKQ
jgi:RNA polymerase sigma factor (sigma-70 family)